MSGNPIVKNNASGVTSPLFDIIIRVRVRVPYLGYETRAFVNFLGGSAHFLGISISTSLPSSPHPAFATVASRLSKRRSGGTFPIWTQVLWQKRGTFTRQCHPPCLHGWNYPESVVQPWTAIGHKGGLGGINRAAVQSGGVLDGVTETQALTVDVIGV